MTDALLDAYLRSAYRVRLPTGGAAVIRVGAPLPAPLRPLANGRDWGFITAWNPRSQPRDARENRAAQRRLLDHALQLPRVTAHPAVGVGTDGWREPSLWLVGIDGDALAGLGRRFGQYGWLQGHGDGPAQLRLAQAGP